MNIQLKITGKGKIPQLAKHLPGVSERCLKHLDETGLPILGSVLQPGDILLGVCRSTRLLNEGERECAELGLHTAGEADLWKDDSIIYNGTVPVIVKKATIIEQLMISRHPLRWLEYCEKLPVGTVLEEIEIVVEPQ